MSEETKTGIKVLLVDDDPTISSIIVDMLNRAGHTVEHIVDSQLTMSTAQQVLPDVIILDLMMTRMSGEQVLLKLQSDEKLKKIPVLVFSNKGIEQDLSHLEEKGAAKTLVKADTSMTELVAVVEELAAGK